MKHKIIIKKTILLIIIALIITNIIDWAYNKCYVTSNDAYVNANVSPISILRGKIKKIHIKNNQYVTRGEPLIELDPEPYEAAITDAKAALLICKAKLKIAQLNYERAPKEPAETFEAAKQSLSYAMQDYTLHKEALVKAKSALTHTKIIATQNAWVTNLSVDIEDNVTSDQVLFSLISDKEFWVEAFFPANKLINVKNGQHVDVTIDNEHDHSFTGVVKNFTSLSKIEAKKTNKLIPVTILIKNYLNQPFKIGSPTKVIIHINKFW